MSSPDEKLQAIRAVIQEWDGKEGHDRCWYYPDLFRRIAAIAGVELTKNPVLPPRSDFEEGCRRYQDEEFGRKDDDDYTWLNGG